MAIPRGKKKDQTRERLLDEAASLIAAKGVAGTTTLKVARAAGVAHGTVFLHFPRREALLEAVVDRFTRQLLADLHDRVGEAASLREVLSAHLEVLGAHEALYARLLSEETLLPAAGRSTLIGLHSVMAVHVSRGAIKDRVRGRLRPQPLHLLFNSWLGLIHHYLRQRELFAPGTSVLARRGPELLEHYLERTAS